MLLLLIDYSYLVFYILLCLRFVKLKYCCRVEYLRTAVDESKSSSSVESLESKDEEEYLER